MRARPWSASLIVAAACGSSEPDSLALPGEQFYPESVAVAADGTLYVSSLPTGQVVRFAPDADTAEPFVTVGAPMGTLGVTVDDAGGTLYLCAANVEQFFAGQPPDTEVRGYDLATAALTATYAFPAAAFCNDLAVDATGALYVADSYGNVYRRAAGAGELALWSDAAPLRPTSPSGFGADGIAIGDGAVFVNTFTDGKLVRIPIAADGSAGAAVELAVTPPLAGPDGMRHVAPSTLLVVNGNSGQLVELAVSATTATATVVAADLLMPTSVTVAPSGTWVTEGQIGVLLGVVAGPPSLPFRLVRVEQN
jgi:sugar lactone lactonase YvrE